MNVESKEEFQLFWDRYGSHGRLSARNAILSQMCPLIYGMYYLKLALALVLTGSSSSNFNGLKVRGESHMLLIGDPGTAKSQFLKFASKIVPRSVITTGIGSTSAGLTVTAVKEAGDWSLEAGALVLADGGVCCIDEFGGMREHDKTTIHEAMEQQTISVAKAGIVCKLHTRCSIIAATNPKGCYDLDRSISANTAIASPLLTRFDLIFLLLDNCNETWDRRVSDFILNHQSTIDNTVNHAFNIDKLKAYFLFIKSNYHPKMTHDASNVLEKYYAWMRKSESTMSLDRITMRFLESLIRLSQSHARFMMRNRVIMEDAIMAVAVMESTVYGSTILEASQQLPSEFPVDPQQEYESLKNVILHKLQIQPSLSSSNDQSNTNIVVSNIITNKPLIKRNYCKTQPLPLRPKDSKILNRSVLDNFHIATQINVEKAHVSNDLLEIGLSDNLFDLGETEENIDINNHVVSMDATIANRNMFTDSISGHPDLTDADFDI